MSGAAANAPFRLLMICRLNDEAVNAREDSLIEKSSLRPLASQEIEVPVGQAFLARAYSRKITEAHVLVLVLPSRVELDQISNLNDAVRLGGRILLDQRCQIPIEKSSKSSF